MSTEENKEVIRRWFEMMNKHDLSIVNEFISANYVYHGPGGREVKGPESFKQAAMDALVAFPDDHYMINDMVCRR